MRKSLSYDKCADQKNGPQYFLTHFFYIQHPIKGKLQYTPYSYQMNLVDNYHNYRCSINLLPRQSGKTTTAAGYLLWYAMFNPGSTILLATKKHSDAQENMQRIHYAYDHCPVHIRAGVTSYNKNSIEFDNGSRIVTQAIAENIEYDMPVTLLCLDEFAYVSPLVAKEFWSSISPTFVTNGKVIITSTINGDEDQFAEIWKEANNCKDAFGNTSEVGINGFKAFSAKWQEHPDQDEKWATAVLRRIGAEHFRHEYESIARNHTIAP